MLPVRFVLEGYADTLPLTSNETSDNRSLNRRVEIIVLKSTAKEEVTNSVNKLNEKFESVEGEIIPVDQTGRPIE